MPDAGPHRRALVPTMVGRLTTGRPSGALAVTGGLIGIIALALGIAQGWLALVMVASVIVFGGAFRSVLRSSRAFAFALANLIASYACIFLFFVESNFAHVPVLVLTVGFVLPLTGFFLGSLRRRHEIHRIVLGTHMREERHFAEVLAWLVPVFAIGAATFVLPQGQETEVPCFLAAMLGIAAIVFFVARDVAVFLLDTVLLFEAFFERIARLVVPAFAFLTLYSLLVMVFAALYSIVDHLSAVHNFRVDGALQAISFPQSLYYSVSTLSTVSYGDIAPASNPIRFITAIEVVCGVLLLLFGFNEIFTFAQQHDRRRRGP